MMIRVKIELASTIIVIDECKRAGLITNEHCGIGNTKGIGLTRRE